MVFIVLSYFTSRFIENQLSPIIIAIAEAEARIMATETVNKSVEEKISKNVNIKTLYRYTRIPVVR